jgi:predicted small lipoprotein YifL
MQIRTLIILLLAVAAVSGCGRRGDLETPGATVTDNAAPALASDGISPLDPGAPTAAADQPQPEPAPQPQRRFFLDFLL